MKGGFWCFNHLDDAQLLERSVRHTLAQGRELTALLIAHLSEIEERRLHLHAACSSMFEYCVNRLGLSEDEACRRIDVARIARRFPSLYPLLADGSVSLSVVALLKPHLTDDNHLRLLEACRELSVLKVRELIANRFPRPDLPSTVRKLPAPRQAPVRENCQALPVVSAPLERTFSWAIASPAPVPMLPPPRAIEPLAPERYKIQLTAGREFKQKLEQCRDLMRHANPSGDFAPILERALDLLLEKLMRERFGAAKQPRLGAKQTKDKRPTRATRRTVVARDGLRCSWVSPEGERCSATSWLELDHVEPLGKGGSSLPNNVRVLCRAHNQLSAEIEFGRNAVERGAISNRSVRAKRDGDDHVDAGVPRP